MAKTKLLTIPIEQEKRDRLNQYCSELNITVSQFITKYIDACLDDSIDSSSSIESSRPHIDIDTIVEKAIDKIVPLMMNKIHDIEQNVMDKTKENETDIFEISNTLISCQRMLRRLNNEIVKYGMKDTALDDVPNSFSPVEKPKDKPVDTGRLNDTYLEKSTISLTDTQNYIKSRIEYNRSCKKRLDRDSNEKIADFLQEHGYPHPDGKKWHRNHISECCKLWAIDNK
jgi:hypothetical protein